MMKFTLLLVPVLLLTSTAHPVSEDEETDGDSSRRIIGSSVVTSVSVVMNGQKPEFTDAIGKPVPRPLVPPQVASPINLLNPDKYEFYTFDESGELIKRLMTMEEIQSIVAGGDGEGSLLMSPTNSTSENETKVDEIVESVQNVLNREMEAKKNTSQTSHPIFDTPDVSSSWSLILPAIFGNTGNHEIITHKPQSIAMTPESELLEVTTKFPATAASTKPTEITMKTTSAPEVTMKATAASTKAPEVTVKATPAPTKAPEVTAKATGAPTKAPTVTMKPTAASIKAPEVTTKAPAAFIKTTETSTKITETSASNKVPVNDEMKNIPLYHRPASSPTSTEKITETPKEEPLMSTSSVTPSTTVKVSTSTKKVSTTPPMRVRVTANPNRTKTPTRKPIETTVQKITEFSTLISRIPAITAAKLPPTRLPPSTKAPEIPSSTTEKPTKKPTESTTTAKIPQTPPSTKRTPQTTSSIPTNSPSTPTSTTTVRTTPKPPTTSAAPQTTKPIEEIVSEVTEKILQETTLASTSPSKTMDTTSVAVEASTMTSALPDGPNIGSTETMMQKPQNAEKTSSEEMASTEDESTAMEENSINQIIQSLNHYPDDEVETPSTVLSSIESMSDGVRGTTVKHPEDTHDDDDDDDEEEKMPTTVKVISVTEPVKSDEPTERTATQPHNTDHVGKPSKIFANNQLYVDETDPQVSEISITPMPEDTTTTVSSEDDVEADTEISQSVTESAPQIADNLVSVPHNSGIVELIDRFIAANTNSIPVTLAPHETQPMIPKVEQMVQNALRKNITMGNFVEQVATVASILHGDEADEPITEKLDFMDNLEESLSHLLSQVTDERPHSVPLVNDPNIESKMPNVDAENVLAEEEATTTIATPQDDKDEDFPSTTTEYQLSEDRDEAESTTFLTEMTTELPTEAEEESQMEITTERRNPELPETPIPTAFDPDKKFHELESLAQIKESVENEVNDKDDVRVETSIVKETSSISFRQDKPKNITKTTTEETVRTTAIPEIEEIRETTETAERTETPELTEKTTEIEEGSTEFSNTIDYSQDSEPQSLDILSIIGTVGDMLLDTKIPENVENLATVPIDESTDATFKESLPTIPSEFAESTEIPTVAPATVSDDEDVPTTTEEDDVEMSSDFAQMQEINDEATSTISPTEATTQIPSSLAELAEETFWTFDGFTGRPTTKFNPLNFRKNDLEENIPTETEQTEQAETTDPATNTVVTDEDATEEITQKTTQRSSPKTTQYKFITIGVNRRDDGTPINVPTPFGFHTRVTELIVPETTTEITHETTTYSHDDSGNTEDDTNATQPDESEEIYTRLGETTEKSPEETTLIDDGKTDENSIVEEDREEDAPTTVKILAQKRPISVFHVNTPKPTNLAPALKQNPRKPVPVNLKPAPKEALGLEQSTQNLDQDLIDFVNLCNELAFTYWKAMTAEGISTSRTVVLAPFAITSMLAMIFLGARGSTSGEMNEILRLDDMVTFNPHAVFRNVTDSIENLREGGVFTSAVVRELFSDRQKGKLLSFYKDKVQQFYSGHVEEVNYTVINDIIRRRTNLLMKRHTWGKVMEFLKTNTITMRPPLATVSANIFKTDCSKASSFDRDGEMFFQISPIVRQRRLVPLPAAVFRSGFMAGYDPELDATAVAFGNSNNVVSTVLVMPGQQGHLQSGDSLDRLEIALLQNGITKNAWRRLLTTLMERPGLELQIPKFTHRSFINATSGLQRMGLNDLFDSEKSDLRGLTASASRDMFFSDMVQINAFATCGEDKSPDQHHVEVYPSPPIQKGFYLGEFTRGLVDDLPESVRMKLLMTQEHQRALFDPFYETKYLELPLSLRPRQARIPEAPRLRFDRPFLFFVRHNPTGMILYMGRFSPRLHP